MAETVTISQDEYDDLLHSDKVLRALQGAGVDNWEGYEFAFEDMSD